ncbi:MAG TPA: hypothetical protein VK390_09525 [Propionibacteriaceae bacterium]|nr:hypothetical protein [Propionibacteriaceae bacterium]
MLAVEIPARPGAGGDDAGDESLDQGNGLLIANLALFAAFFVGMIICGVQVYNPDQG